MLLFVFSILPIIGIILYCTNDSYLNFKIQIPAPRNTCTKPLQSSLLIELTGIVSDISQVTTQLDSFIDKFNELLLANPINVLVNAMGDLSADVPVNMPEEQARELSNRMSILDRLINTQSGKVSTLVDEGLVLENRIIKEENPNFKSIILDKIKELEDVKKKYRHW